MLSQSKSTQVTKQTKLENVELKCYVIVCVLFMLGLILHQLDVSIIQNPYPHHFIQIAYKLSYAIAMAILVSIFVTRRLEAPYKEAYEAKLVSMREALNQDVFAEVFKRIIPDKIFETIKSDVILTEVCRSDFKLRHEFIVQQDGSIKFNERSEYTLLNITKNKLVFPISLHSRRDNFRLDRVDWEVNGISYSYDANNPSDDKNNLIDSNTPNIINIPTVIPANGQIHITSIFHRIYDRYNIRTIAGEYFFRHPTTNATIEIIFPPNYDIILSNWLSAIIRRKEKSETRRSYVFKKAVLPHVGFTYYIKKKEEPVQNMEALGIVTDNLLHNFNNNLQIMFGFLDLASQSLSEILTDEQCDRVAHTNKVKKDLGKIKTLLSTVQGNILRLQNYSSKSKSGRYPLSLSIAVNEAIHLSSLKSSIQVQVSIVTHDDTIMLNPIQIRYVLIGLIDKICESRSEKNVLLKLRLENFENKNKKWVRLTICRTNLSEKNEILELFNDIKKEITNKNTANIDLQSSPLGLDKFQKVNLNRIIEQIEKWDGSFEYEFDSENNITFKIQFQIWEKDEKHRDLYPDTILKSFKKGIRILLIDDSPLVSETSMGTLEKEGFIVSEFTNGNEALVKFKKNHETFDIVITDTNMPEISGIELGRKIKEIRYDIPVIIATGGDERIDDKNVREMGFQGQIRKPYEVSTIKKLITDIVSK
jgi:CheY-like chemotaxis protein